MMKKIYTHGYFLESSRMLIQNSKDDEQISALILPYKVNEQKLEEGLALCTRAYKVENLQIKLHGQQYRAYKKFEKAFAEVNEVCQIHLKFLKISFEKDTEKLKEISAYGTRSANIPNWFKQAFAFYQNTVVDEEAMAELDSYGITAEMFQENESKITEVEAAFLAHKIKLGAAQDAVVQRDDVFKELATYVKRLRAICRIALKDHPQLLEKLGIKAYSEGYVRAKPKTNGEQPPADGGTTQTAAPEVQTAPNNNKKKKENS
jgi:hypothetical protein